MEISSVVLQSVEGTQTELMMTAGTNLRPVLLNPSLCANVVLKVRTSIKSLNMGYYFSFQASALSVLLYSH